MIIKMLYLISRTFMILILTVMLLYWANAMELGTFSKIMIFIAGVIWALFKHVDETLKTIKEIEEMGEYKNART